MYGLLAMVLLGMLLYGVGALVFGMNGDGSGVSRAAMAAPIIVVWLGAMLVTAGVAGLVIGYNPQGIHVERAIDRAWTPEDAEESYASGATRAAATWEADMAWMATAAAQTPVAP